MFWNEKKTNKGEKNKQKKKLESQMKKLLKKILIKKKVIKEMQYTYLKGTNFIKTGILHLQANYKISCN